MVSDSAPTRFRFDRFELQVDERVLLDDGKPLRLGGHAFDVLVALVQRPGQLLTKSDLLQRVWSKVVVEENTLQVHMSALRKALGRKAIATVPGHGYRFELAVRAPDAVRHNLRQALTSFVGRERELRDILECLRRTRLLTLTGAGGCGKTRLALQVAGAALEVHRDGAWVVELAPLRDPALLPPAVARALDIGVPPGQDVDDSVVEYLRTRQLLLVLDNAEHLLDACAAWTDQLLRQCPGLTVLVTSRERLAVDGELAWRVPSLTLPTVGEDPMAFEATRLFVERARLHRPDFVLADDDASTLTAVCRRLDGIALAIELAAAQMRLMSLPTLYRGLDDRFRLLDQGSRTAAPRHRTLASLMDWSYDLLSETERTLLRRLAVFAGGWTLEAAERVCGFEPIVESEIGRHLTALVDKSLVVAEPGSQETRYDMLETVRHYALECLAAASEADALRERHLAYVEWKASGLSPSRSDADVQRALSALGAEHDNLRAALAWCEAPGRARAGLRLAGNLNWFWNRYLLHKEARTWLERLLHADNENVEDAVHAAAYQIYGGMAWGDGDAIAAIGPLQSAVRVWRQVGNPLGAARSLGLLGEVDLMLGHAGAAREHFAQALVVAREHRDERSQVLALLGLGQAEHWLGHDADALAALDEAQLKAAGVGPGHEYYAWTVRGNFLHRRADLDGARLAAVRAHEASRTVGDKENAGYALLLQALIAQDRDDLVEARSLMSMPLALYPGISGASLSVWLPAFAGLLSALVGPIEGARLWGCAERHRSERRLVMHPLDVKRQKNLEKAARRGLGNAAAFDRAWIEGRDWSLDQAFRYARTLS